MRAYEAFAWKLEEEYELEPSAETRAVVARIRAEPGESKAAAPAGSSTGPTLGAAAALPTEGGGVVPTWLRRSRASWKRVGILVATLAALMAAGWVIRNQLRPAGNPPAGRAAAGEPYRG